MRAKRLKKRSQTWQKPVALSLFSLFTLGASSALLATEPLPEEASREEPPEIPATAWSFAPENASPSITPHAPTQSMGIEIQSEPREPLYAEPVDLPVPPYIRFPSSNVENNRIAKGEETPTIRIGVEWVSEPSEELAIIRQTMLLLEASLPQYTFDVKVVEREKLEEAMRNRTMDVFITETGFYLEGVATGLSALAALVPLVAQDPNSAYAGVVIVREDSNFKKLEDILSGPIATLAEEPMSGYLPVRAEIARKTNFTGEVHGTHGYGEQRQVVADVQAGRYQSGILRSCFLENLILREGEKPLEGLKILSPVAQDGLECIHSTQAYPGWVVSFAPTLSAKVAKEMAEVFLSDAIPANSAFWDMSTDYGKAAALYKTLQLGPYSYLTMTSAEGVIYRYRKEIAVVLLVIAALVAHGFLLRRLVNRRTRELQHLYEREREMKAAALETTRQLEALQRIGAVNQMSNVLTHELLQPLTSIRNLTRGAERTLEDDVAQTEELMEALAQIEAQTQKASAIVERVRAYTKGRREKLGSAKREMLSLDKEVRDAVESFKLTAKSQGIEIELGELAPIRFAMELLDFELIILNLLSNAVDATREKEKPRITVSLTPNYEQENKALATSFTLTVSDNGGAVTEADLRRMEASVLESTKPDGLGLGLTIIRHLASLTLGRVDFSRNADGGLCARVTWPLPEVTPPTDNGTN